MGQPKPIQRSAFDRREAFREAVLKGAESLSREDIRQLADDLHDMARDRVSIGGLRPTHAGAEEEGEVVWL